ncbi:MAG: ATPase [Sphaerochaetaceae bacterium]
MIVEMKRVSLVIKAKEKRGALNALRKLGLLHVDEVKSTNSKIEDLGARKSSLEKVLSYLNGYEAQQKAFKEAELENLYETVLDLIEEKALLGDEIRLKKGEYEGLREWGDFNPAEIVELTKHDIELTFYRVSPKELAKLEGGEVSYLRLSTSGKHAIIATVNSLLPSSVTSQKLTLPEKSLTSLAAEIEEGQARLARIEEQFKSMAGFVDGFKHSLALIAQEERFEIVSASTNEEGQVAWLRGYLPSESVEEFKNLAAKEKWAYLIDTPTEEEEPPTLIKNKPWVAIIKPVFDILGTVPGYREYDISMWFLFFFALFFAMIVGDAAYGTIFLIGAIALHIKLKRANNAIILLYVLSLTSIVWGSITGTWFGSKAVLEALPGLKALIIPQIANYPELFGIEATLAQNMVMKLCFIIGTAQLSLACAMNVWRKLGQKSLAFIADIGWLIMIGALYFLVLMLVIGAPTNLGVVTGVVIAGFVLVILFSGQAPGLPFSKGLSRGAAGTFSTFLDSISAFSNIISYIRLFAVGMASLAIAQSFNSMASPMLRGFALPAGILILVIGHGLNLVMALLSVVVHGVRLNLLEFSGQLGMEWSGVNYNPFRETVKTTKNTL